MPEQFVWRISVLDAINKIEISAGDDDVTTLADELAERAVHEAPPIFLDDTNSWPRVNGNYAIGLDGADLVVTLTLTDAIERDPRKRYLQELRTRGYLADLNYNARRWQMYDEMDISEIYREIADLQRKLEEARQPDRLFGKAAALRYGFEIDELTAILRDAFHQEV